MGATTDSIILASFYKEDSLGTPIASASTTTIGTLGGGDSLHITGTTTINSFGVSTTGALRILTFDGALTLTYNATSLILPTSTNIITTAGDVAEFICENGTSGYWRCIGYQRKNGTSLYPYAPLASPALTGTPTAPTATAGTNTTQIATTAMVHSAITNDLHVTGTAPMYACRAWANFDGTNTLAIRASGNVSSITDNGVGNYTVNFTTSMPDANYAGVTTTGGDTSAASSGTVGWCYSYTTSSLHIGVTDNNNDTSYDNSNINVAIFR
jgi:hypothetical protein